MFSFSVQFLADEFSIPLLSFYVIIIQLNAVGIYEQGQSFLVAANENSIILIKICFFILFFVPVHICPLQNFTLFHMKSLLTNF